MTDDVILDFDNVLVHLSTREDTQSLVPIFNTIKATMVTLLETNKSEEEESVLKCVVRQILLWIIEFTKPNEDLINQESDNLETLIAEKDNLILAYKVSAAEMESELDMRLEELDRLRVIVETKNKQVLTLQIQLEEFRSLLDKTSKSHNEAMEEIRKELAEKEYLAESLLSSHSASIPICALCKGIIGSSEGGCVQEEYLEEMENKIVEQKNEIASLRECLKNTNKLLSISKNKCPQHLIHLVNSFKIQLRMLKDFFNEFKDTINEGLANVILKAKIFPHNKAISLESIGKGKRVLFLPYSSEGHIMVTLNNLVKENMRSNDIIKRSTDTLIYLDTQNLSKKLQGILNNFKPIVIGVIESIKDKNGKKACIVRNIEHVIKFEEHSIIDYSFIA